MKLRHVVSATLLGIVLVTWGNALWIYAKAWLAGELLRQAWATTLAEGAPGVKPWPWADTWPVARLRSSTVGVDLIALEGDAGSSLAFGPGRITAAGMPGEPSATVFAGHRDTHFDFLRHLTKGDTLQVQTHHGEWLDYRVQELVIADASEGSWTVPEEGGQLHLITCYPFDAVTPGGPLRYVVIAELTNRNEWSYLRR